MALVSLKRTKKEMKESNECTPVRGGSSSDEPQYPWGTRIDFNKAVLNKLGIDPLKVSLGDTMEGPFKLEIINIRKESLELQITDIDIGGGAVKKPSIEKKIAKYKEIRDGYPTQD